MSTDVGTFYLDCDALDAGLGSMLSQEKGGSEVVIAYASRALSKSERNYGTTKHEFLAIVYGLKTYRQYLLRRHFVIRTDHSVLHWLRKTPEPMAQLARWLVFIEQFDFDVMDRPGLRHGNADGLSTKPTEADEADGIVRGGCGDARSDEPDDSPGVLVESGGEHPSLPSEPLADLQLLDPEVGPIVRLRLQQAEKPDIEQVLPFSEASKMFHGQWFQLEVVDGGARSDRLQEVSPRPSLS